MTFLSLVTLCCAAFAMATAQTWKPGITEVDLVFPRANETYKPTYPFPIVISIQNPAAIWQFGFAFYFDIQPVSHMDCCWGWGSFPEADGDLETHGTYNGSDTITTIYATDAIQKSNGTAKEWILFWRSATLWNCTPPAEDGQPPTFSNSSLDRFGSIYFNISDDGDLPIINATGAPCPVTASTIKVKEAIENRGNPYQTKLNYPFPYCPYFDPDTPRPEGNPCAVKASDELARNVTKKMLDTAACVGNTAWPNSSLTGPCNDRYYRGSSDAPVVMARCSTMALAAFLLFVATWEL
ncbi:hypothetical protein QBC33DRAFT_617547 [Phialemonium atrogriseum]|uniref:DUF7136 domain-containing protein n=1 Tax=Phialemonium atrogriseum TaxID=1093897 RepID=A0AAJ0FRL3_9PEZI|nr:uncharacterized protein QBC33DRAFT_617547 [Phialemonium atrogriseum]KAK1770265.1 hypothetical protein QBC33DRAFT_617547 [Phialemonium atrogriseum]